MATRPKAGSVETRHTEIATDGRKIHGIVPYGVESRDLGGCLGVGATGRRSGSRPFLQPPFHVNCLLPIVIGCWIGGGEGCGAVLDLRRRVSGIAHDRDVPKF